MRTILITLPIFLLLLGPSTATASDAAAKPPHTQLGSPAQAEAVQVALDAVAAGEEDEIVLARALAGARGVEAARGLLVLAKHRDPAVRTEALLGLARVGLRSDKLAKAVHDALTGSFSKPKERWAAVSALGAVGDGRDMATLLAISGNGESDRELRTAAFRAMGAITGARIPFVHTRWSYWWRKHEARGTSRIRAAVAALEKAPASPESVAHEAALAAYGWVAPEVTAAALKRWLGGSPRGLGKLACRLAAYLRLADLASSIDSAGKRLAQDDLRQAVEDALARLGVVREQPVR